MQSPTPFLRIGTRGSPLALWQAQHVQQKLSEAHGVDVQDIEIKSISTAGDRSQPANRPLIETGGKGTFSKEIEDQLIAGQIDVAVHSTKDMAAILPDGLVMPVFLTREDVRDAFISLKYTSIDDMPQGAILGSSSIRRRAQIRRYRPDIQMVEFRGNVGTRLQKFADGVADATLLAAAGLIRMEMQDRITAFLDPEKFPPAPAQGAIGLEIRENDTRTASLIAPLDDALTHAGIIAERKFLQALDGSCRTPIGALTRIERNTLNLTGQILSLDGQEVHEGQLSAPLTGAAELGTELGQIIRAAAGPDFFAKLMAE